jgi:hypothetical protein
MPVMKPVYNVRPQNQGVKNANKHQGGPPTLPEAMAITVSPAKGVVPSGLIGDFRAGGPSPASVLGTGNNADLKVYSAEAV